jgi:hypothetical protein
MLNEILGNKSNELISALKEKVGLEQDEAKQALDLTKENLVSKIGKEAMSGNFDGVLNMVNKGSSAGQSPLFQNIIGGLNSDFISKMGLSPEIANKISTMVLPAVIKAISDYKEGNLNTSDLGKMFGKEMGGSVFEKAGGLFKGGLGNFLK